MPQKEALSCTAARTMGVRKSRRLQQKKPVKNLRSPRKVSDIILGKELRMSPRTKQHIADSGVCSMVLQDLIRRVEELKQTERKNEEKRKIRKRKMLEQENIVSVYMVVHKLN
ncbi:MAG: hypothetical protein SGPRY_001170 [Prymnesium sp.]